MLRFSRVFADLGRFGRVVARVFNRLPDFEREIFTDVRARGGASKGTAEGRRGRWETRK